MAVMTKGKGKPRKAPAYTYPSAQDIIAERDRRGLSQSEAAEMLGVSLRQWQYYEEGQAPSRPVAKLLTMFVACKKIP